MDLQVKIHNVLHIAEAELRLESGRITAVRGPNASGKTSTALIAGALLAGADNPLNIGKGQGKLYLRDGADAGSAELFLDGEPVRKWNVVADELTHYPAAAAPSVSEGAVGLVDFTATLSAPVRVAMWEGYFLPPAAELHALIAQQLKGLVSPVVYEEIMELIKEGKLDEIVKAYTARARTAKAEWMGVAGSTWGKAKGADWLPEGWLSELDGVSAEAAELKVQEARDDLALLQRDHAVSAAEIERAAEAAAKLPELRERLEEAQEALTAAREEFAAENDRRAPLEKTLNDLRVRSQMLERDKPSDDAAHALTCPECEAGLILAEGKLVAFDAAAAEAASIEWREKYAAALEQLETATRTVMDFDAALEKLVEKGKPLSSAVAKIEAEIAMLTQQSKMADAQPSEDMSEQAEAAENEIERRVKQYELVAAREAAQVHHRNILDYTAVATQLGPKGVRSTALQEAMSRLDNALGTIADISGWPRVTIDKTYSVGIGDRKVMRVCAESERLRAQYALQIGVARSRLEPVVILDQADHLDTANTIALFRLLNALMERPNPPAVLVCGTDLDTATHNSAGTNYRLDNGVLVPDGV